MARAYLLHSSFKARAQQLGPGRDPHPLPNNATHVPVLEAIRPRTGPGLSEPVDAVTEVLAH